MGMYWDRMCINVYVYVVSTHEIIYVQYACMHTCVRARIKHMYDMYVCAFVCVCECICVCI